MKIPIIARSLAQYNGSAMAVHWLSEMKRSCSGALLAIFKAEQPEERKARRLLGREVEGATEEEEGGSGGVSGERRRRRERKETGGGGGKK